MPRFDAAWRGPGEMSRIRPGNGKQHFICFPVDGIPKVKRDQYVIFDRQSLRYLNVIEKLNCTYCSYFNGLIVYVQEIAARTEQYWCPIKHARRIVAMRSRYK